MVMQTTGFNQEDMQLSLVMTELNVVSIERGDFYHDVLRKPDLKLILRKLVRIFLKRHSTVCLTEAFSVFVQHCNNRFKVQSKVTTFQVAVFADQNNISVRSY